MPASTSARTSARRTWTAAWRRWSPTTAAGCGLRKAYADTDVLRADVLEVLGQVALLVPDGDGFRLHPAAARYAPQTTYAEGLF